MVKGDLCKFKQNIAPSFKEVDDEFMSINVLP